ncbi:MAG: hypothetical protein WCM93_14615 [Bacteroidota bacterium]
MKKTLSIFTLIALFVITSFLAQAQPAPGLQSGDAPVTGGPIGGGAPVGSGLCILLAMGLAYGASKLFRERSEDSVQD